MDLFCRQSLRQRQKLSPLESRTERIMQMVVMSVLGQEYLQIFAFMTVLNKECMKDFDDYEFGPVPNATLNSDVRPLCALDRKVSKQFILKLVVIYEILLGNLKTVMSKLYIKGHIQFGFTLFYSMCTYFYLQVLSNIR